MILAVVVGLIACARIITFSCIVVSGKMSELEHPERIEMEEWK